MLTFKGAMGTKEPVNVAAYVNSFNNAYYKRPSTGRGHVIAASRFAVEEMAKGGGFDVEFLTSFGGVTKWIITHASAKTFEVSARG